MIRICSKASWGRKIILGYSFMAGCSAAALAADTITGVARNQTQDRLAAGDEVILLRLDQGMQEEDRTKTDSKGAFSVKVLSPDKLHIVRIVHQGVNYDQAVSGTAPLEMSVYDSVPKIPGLSGEIGIAQVESDGKTLKITEMYAITNASNPPVTQSRPDNFEISLPENAAFDSVEVRSGGGMWVKVAPDLIKGKNRKYGINFPMRPGDTLFKFAYHLPYRDHTAFHLKLPYPIARFGVMHPPSMSFKALRPGAFTSPGIASGLQVEQAVARPVIGDVPAFEIWGVGTAAEHGTQTRAAPPSPAASVPTVSTRSAQINAAVAADQSREGPWLMIVATVVTLAAGTAIVLWMNSSSFNRTRKSTVAAASASGKPGPPLLDSLKEELFQLESDRLHGAITSEEYATTKQALNAVIERALARK